MSYLVNVMPGSYLQFPSSTYHAQGFMGGSKGDPVMYVTLYWTRKSAKPVQRPKRIKSIRKIPKRNQTDGFPKAYHDDAHYNHVLASNDPQQLEQDIDFGLHWIPLCDLDFAGIPPGDQIREHDYYCFRHARHFFKYFSW